MTKLSGLLESFFNERLIREMQASVHTIFSYRDTFCLLLRYAAKEYKKKPSEILLKDLDSKFISEFLSQLETVRKNTVRTRNTRLAAIHSFFHFLAYKVPERSLQISQVLSIPQKRFNRNLVIFLEPKEIEALLTAPNQKMWQGRRDYLLMLILVQTGFRVSELIELKVKDVTIDRGAYIRCIGKGRKQRDVPLTKQATKALKAWIKDEQAKPDAPLFVSRRAEKLSRDSIERLITKYCVLASNTCPSLRNKKISPHSLRHTAAMQLLRANVDTSIIALYLGHESAETTQVYLHSDLKIKEKALSKVDPTKTKGKRYKPADATLAFLEAL